MSDVEHFAEVANVVCVRAVLRDLSLTCEIYRRGQTHNDGLKIGAERWRVPCRGGGVAAIDVHYESRRPGHIQIDVELYPYEGSVAKKPGRREEIEPQLRLRSRILRELRDQIMGNGFLVKDFGANERRLMDIDNDARLCAASFDSGLSPDCGALAHGEFVSRVISNTAKVIDAAIAVVSK
jgi:hypothetical protein